MATTVEAPERAAIEAAVQLYIDASATGDAAKLEEAFVDGAWMYGSLGECVDVPITELAKMVAEHPLGSDVYEARITSVEQVGDAAVVRLEEDGC